MNNLIIVILCVLISFVLGVSLENEAAIKKIDGVKKSCNCTTKGVTK